MITVMVAAIAVQIGVFFGILIMAVITAEKQNQPRITMDDREEDDLK